MKLYRFDPGVSRETAEYGSRGALVSRLLRTPGEASIHCLALAPGGVLGWHPAVEDQLLLVVQGEGRVRGEPGDELPISAGQAAFWTAGEHHATRTDHGLTAIILEGQGLDPGEFMPEAPTLG